MNDKKLSHLEFVDQLNIAMPRYNDFELNDYELFSNKIRKSFKYSRNQDLDKESLDFLVLKCINMDEWKYAMHFDIRNADNYEKLIKIIQNKILIRDKEIRILFEGYFQLIKQLENGTN